MKIQMEVIVVFRRWATNDRAKIWTVESRIEGYG